jgi:glycosyltransferase involved in cell wall biosynthesis/peptidoglycan/xylan/chitin deacetylase (PgdA/CDA1 family)
LRLRRHLRDSAPDVVHTFFPVANIFGVLCARRAGVPTIVASRRDYGHWMTPRYVKATRFANRYLHGIVTNSAQVKELTTRVEGVPADRIAVIANGVDLDAVRRRPPNLALKAQLNIPADAVVIGLVANFRPVKRHDTLIHAFARLLPTRPNIHLLLIGGDNEDDPAKGSVVALTQSLGVDAHCRYAQAVGNVGEFLSILDVGVNSSESEGLSNAIVEYMCAEVPCVISDGGGNRDLVDDEHSGLLFPVGDDAQLASQLARMLDDEALRRTCTANALAMVRRRMELSSVLCQFEAQYRTFGDAASAQRAKGWAPSSISRAAKSLVIKSMAAEWASSLARRTISNRSIAVLMYHEIGADSADIDAWQVVRESEFRRQVDALRQRFDVVSLDEATHRMAERSFEDRPMAVLTFDDGDVGNVERLLPIVERDALPVTVYVATQHIQEAKGFWFDRIVNRLQSREPIALDLSDFGLGSHVFNHDRGAQNWARIQRLLQAIKAMPADRCEQIADDVDRRLSANGQPALTPMTPAQVTQLARCRHVTLGSHSHGHEVMTLLTDDEVRASVAASLDWLMQWTGQLPRHFAFPGGFHDQRVEAVIQSMGFATAMGGDVGLWQPDTSPLAIPRLHVGRYDSLERFGIQLDWGQLLRHRQVGMRALGWALPIGTYPWTDWQ